jgi:hypothetical protein
LCGLTDGWDCERTFHLLLWRHPALSAVTLTVLALGLGATTAMFRVVNSVLLRPLPFRDPARLVMIEEKWPPRFPRFEASPQDFLSWKAERQSFSDIAAYRPVAFNLTELLGVSPILGRSFRADEDPPGRNHAASGSGGSGLIPPLSAAPSA